MLPQAESRELTVVLALPHEHENGGNCLQMEQRAERPVRWRLAGEKYATDTAKTVDKLR